MVEVPDEPIETVMLVRFGEMLKSGGGIVIANVTNRVWVPLPLVPLRMTVQYL